LSDLKNHKYFLNQQSQKRGNIAQEILALANKEKFDLIVMGSKGRTGIVDALMGSVAQKISNAAKQPVLLVK
jgi:nucleotide-binding universal stress UspA family protein